MLKIGILGGGQLGRMMLQQAANYPVETFILENDANCPSANLCSTFVLGNIRDYDDVYNFGKNVDVLTIEIENVNIDALEALENEGKRVVPNTRVLRTIKSKIVQKDFYVQNEIPSPKYTTTQKLADLQNLTHFLPAVHKIAEGGYDGRGVVVINSSSEISKGFDAPSVLEQKVDIAKEVSVIVAANKSEIVIYPPLEMLLNKQINQLDYQVCPAQITEKILWRLEAIAIKLVKNLASDGLFAVEFLIDYNDDVWVNETAPRVHNSGHHSIEAHYSSQYDMLLRILMDYPLGNTDAISPSALINLVGEDGYEGEVYYEGLKEVLKFENVYVHIYGKAKTKPGRKMGHITVLGKDRQDLIYRSKQIKEIIKVVSKKD